MGRLRNTPVEISSPRRTPRGAKAAHAGTPAARPIAPPRIFAYVDAVARHGSIRKAADALHIVSSALNRRVLDLEEELGSQLFERTARGVRPTAAGEIFVDYVRRSIRELEQVGTRIEGLRGLLQGRVRIAVAESVTGHMLPEAIARFQQGHPNVAFHVWMDGPKGLADLLTTDAVDLIVTHDLPERPDLTTLASVHQPFCALVASDHPLAGRASLQLRDCLEYRVAMPDATLAARALIDQVLMRASYKLEPALVSNSVEMTKTFARHNQGVCFQFRIGGEPDPSGMVEIPLTDPPFQRGRLLLAVRRHRVLPVAAGAFAALLEQVFETL
jgi:DNA-binding transcriptional LysR family regulator